MPRALRKLIERQIEKARLQGQLDGLRGEGAPLPDRPQDALVDTADSVSFRIMAQAGVVPEEIEIKKALDAHHKRLVTLQDEDARKAAMAELAQLEMRYNIAREARRKFMSK